MRTLFAVSIMLLLFSCNKKKKLPEGILEPQKMQFVFWDYIRADVYAKNVMKKDSSGNDTIQNIKLQNKIFNFYNISRKDFYKSYDYYTTHPELMNVLMDSILARQNRLKLKDQLNINKNRVLPVDRNKNMMENRNKAISDDEIKMRPAVGNKPIPFNIHKKNPAGNKKINRTQKELKAD